MFQPGDKVDILERGEWVGPFRVIDPNGYRRSSIYHIILAGDHGMFQVYNDAPFNVRLHGIDLDSQDSGDEE